MVKINLYEYQSKQRFKQYEIPVPQSCLAEEEGDILKAYEMIDNEKLGVVKAQVLTGGRGRAGGIKKVDSLKQAQDAFKNIMNMKIKGLSVKKVLVEEKLEIKNEFYLGITIDPGAHLPVLMLSPKGGMDIEMVASEIPETLGKYIIDPTIGLPSFEIIALLARLQKLGFQRDVWYEFTSIAHKLYKLFSEEDATLVEINPLVETKQGKLIAADGKLDVDNNALFRQPEILKFKNDFEEITLKEKGIDYVYLGEGEVGLFCAGAGMTMLSMDLVNEMGYKVAHFLDVSHGINHEGFSTAFNILYSDPSIKCIFVNMFGGLTRMDQVAEVLLHTIYSRENERYKPVIIRLQGTNIARGLRILREAGYIVHTELEKALKQLKGILGGK